MLAMVGSLIQSRSRSIDASWSALIAATTLSRPGSPGFATAIDDQASAVAASMRCFACILTPSNPVSDAQDWNLPARSSRVRPMRYFLDTEYDGFGGKLLSIALVPEDGGEEFYAVI